MIFEPFYDEGIFLKLSEDLIDRLEFNTIRKCISKYAHNNISREKLNELSPTNKVYVLEEEVEKMREFLTLVQYDQGFPIQDFIDIRAHLKRLQPEGASIREEQFAELSKQLEIVRNIQMFLGTNKERFQHLYQYHNQLAYFPEVVRYINRCIDATGTLQDSASPALQRIRKEIRHKESHIRTKIQSLAKRFKEHLVDDDLMTIRNGKHVLAVKSERANYVSGVIHDYSGSGSTVYIEPSENVEASTAIQKLYAEEKKEIERILVELGNRVRPHIAELIENFECLVQLDIRYAKAMYGKSIRGILPELNTKNQNVILKKAYHPVLLENHPRTEIVPVTIEFGSKENKVVLISGPNAGGKTITLKTVGLISLMFQSGIPVPCHEKSSLPLYHKIYCDIGDNQSIENDLSTFSSHLVRIKEILNESSVDSLVLMDELGTGTDPREGAGLAQAILQDLVSKQSNVIATTHLGELKLYGNETEGIENASMEFDEEHLRSTFRLVQGIPGSSYAFFIAKRMGLPDSVIENGRQFVGDKQNSIEGLLNKLNRQVYETEQLRAEFDVKSTRAASLEKMYENKLERLKKFEADTKKKALQDADMLLADVNKKIENTITDIKNAQAEKERVKSARDEVAKLKQSIKQKKSDLNQRLTSQTVEQIDVGDKVRHLEFGTIGEIISKEKKFYKVQAGIMTLRLKRTEFELVEKKAKENAPEKKKKKTVVGGQFSTEVKNEIDLRGLMFEEAWDKCDAYIDYASMTGWNEVTIIHGKGTGALREKINEKLRFDSRIKSKRFGNEGEGSTGVTLVTLRH